MSDQATAWKKHIPVPVFDKNSEFIELYWTAWEQAHAHLKEGSGLPQSPYVDEAFWDDSIWIWDTCFMALFCKYSPLEFPGVESLKNFYVPLHTQLYVPGTFPLNIQHPDNPPLFAWAEYDNYLFTNNNDHIVNLLTTTQYLQKHFEWLEAIVPGWRFESMAEIRKQSAPVTMRKAANGYYWAGAQSGMDNTPRKGGFWIDALAQQGLSALYIARLAERIEHKNIAGEWEAKFNAIKNIINNYYWDEHDGIYYDVDPETHARLKVKTPASYWPMFAEMCSPDQASKMVKHITDPDVFGGERPWVTVARNDPAFTKPDGNYWRGAIWLPTAYMGTKALEKYGYYDEADKAAEKLLMHMIRTYREYEPHIIWECYSPTRDAPATDGKERVRPNFCGWSALGPISLFIENVLGFHMVDAQKKCITWRIHQPGRHGIANLHFGDIVTDIIYNDENGCVAVKSNAPYALVINGSRHDIKSGLNAIELGANVIA